MRRNGAKQVQFTIHNPQYLGDISQLVFVVLREFLPEYLLLKFFGRCFLQEGTAEFHQFSAELHVNEDHEHHQHAGEVAPDEKFAEVVDLGVAVSTEA